MRPATTYRAFLVRMWGHGCDADRRFSAVDVESGERCVFADVDDLCAWFRSLDASGVNAVELVAPPHAPRD